MAEWQGTKVKPTTSETFTSEQVGEALEKESVRLDTIYKSNDIPFEEVRRTLLYLAVKFGRPPGTSRTNRPAPKGSDALKASEGERCKHGVLPGIDCVDCRHQRLAEEHNRKFDRPASEDGLVSPCVRCKKHPVRLDYIVDDHYWKRVVPKKQQNDVVCWDCLNELDAMNGGVPSKEIRRIWLTGKGTLKVDFHSNQPTASDAPSEGWEVVGIFCPKWKVPMSNEAPEVLCDAVGCKGEGHIPLIRQTDADKKDVQHVRDLQDIQERLAWLLLEANNRTDAADRKLDEELTNVKELVEAAEESKRICADLNRKLDEAEARVKTVHELWKEGVRHTAEYCGDVKLSNRLRTLIDREAKG